MNKKTQLTGMEIAIIGMHGEFPGAKNIASFWENLREGKETISFFSDEESKQKSFHKDSTSLESVYAIFPRCKFGCFLKNSV